MPLTTTTTTATPTISQYPIITSYWVETLITTHDPAPANAKDTLTTMTTWVEVIYTQTFGLFPGGTALASVGDATLGAGAGTGSEVGVRSGNVGLGTLNNSVGAVRTGGLGEYRGGAGSSGSGRRCFGMWLCLLVLVVITSTPW